MSDDDEEGKLEKQENVKIVKNILDKLNCSLFSEAENKEN